MNYTGDNIMEELNETPKLMPNSSEIWEYLESDASNVIFGAKLHKKKVETILESDDEIMFRTGDLMNGYIVRLDKHNNKISFFVRYVGGKFGVFTNRVTQLLVWRKQGSRPITTFIFFNYLLPKFGAVMSDDTHTEDGQKFWLSMMSEAKARKHGVGVYDVNRRQYNKFDGTGSITDWAHNTGAWGETNKHKSYRFVIEK